jgi:hypothetical protein
MVWLTAVTINVKWRGQAIAHAKVGRRTAASASWTVDTWVHRFSKHSLDDKIIKRPSETGVMMYEKRTLDLRVDAGLTNGIITFSAPFEGVSRIPIVCLVLVILPHRSTAESAKTSIACCSGSRVPPTLFPSHLFDGIQPPHQRSRTTVFLHHLVYFMKYGGLGANAAFMHLPVSFLAFGAREEFTQ